MGIGDWGFGDGGLGVWPQPQPPNPQSPIPNPQSPIPNNSNLNILKIFIISINIKRLF